MRKSELAVRGYSIDAMRLLAKKTLPRFVFDFGDGAAEDEWTLRRNEHAFDDFMLAPKPLEGAADRDLSFELFGSPEISFIIWELSRLLTPPRRCTLDLIANLFIEIFRHRRRSFRV